MSLGSMIILNGLYLIAGAQKECNHPATAESKVSCGASAKRVEPTDSLPGPSYLQIGTKSDADEESALDEADRREDPQHPARDRQDATVSGTVTYEGAGVVPDAEVVLLGSTLLLPRDLREYAADHSDIRKALYKVPHREGIAGTAAQFAWHVNDPMNRDAAYRRRSRATVSAQRVA
jgi:hypothetical protein